MAGCHLRIYYGPGEEAEPVTVDPSRHRTVTVPLRDVLATLADAVRNHRMWLQDFEDDEVTISTDLYEVILAYQHYRRPVA